MAASIAARCLRVARPTATVAASSMSRGMFNSAATPLARRPFSTTMINFERRYTRDHEWIELSSDRKSGTIGISEYAAEQLGDVVYVELPTVASGEWIEQGDALGAVESVKSASDINAPLRCRVTNVNLLLEEKPATINQVSEDESNGGGWVAKVELDEKSLEGLDQLMDAEEYKTFADSDH